MAFDSASDRAVLFITRKWPPAVGGMETYSHRLSGELAKHVPVQTVALPGAPSGLPPGPGGPVGRAGTGAGG